MISIYCGDLDGVGEIVRVDESDYVMLKMTEISHSIHFPSFNHHFEWYLADCT